VARPVSSEQRDGGLFHGKNPRRLQFFANVRGHNKVYMTTIHEKMRLGRQELLKGLPDSEIQLDSATVDLLAKWIAKRYTRPAFPDEFNARCRPAAKKISNRLKAKGDLITGLFLQLSSYEELPPERDYNVILRVTALPETCEDPNQEKSALSLLAEVEKALNDCDGIHVVDAALDSERDFSLYELRFAKRWDYDFLSYREDTPEHLAPGD